jgi:hypothetical protein
MPCCWCCWEGKSGDWRREKGSLTGEAVSALFVYAAVAVAKIKRSIYLFDYRKKRY